MGLELKNSSLESRLWTLWCWTTLRFRKYVGRKSNRQPQQLPREASLQLDIEKNHPEKISFSAVVLSWLRECKRQEFSQIYLMLLKFLDGKICTEQCLENNKIFGGSHTCITWTQNQFFLCQCTTSAIQSNGHQGYFANAVKERSLDKSKCDHFWNKI